MACIEGCKEKEPIPTFPDESIIVDFPLTVPTDDADSVHVTPPLDVEVGTMSRVLIRGEIDVTTTETPMSTIIVQWQLPRTGQKPINVNSGRLQVYRLDDRKVLYFGHITAPKTAGTFEIVLKSRRTYVGRSQITVVQP